MRVVLIRLIQQFCFHFTHFNISSFSDCRIGEEDIAKAFDWLDKNVTQVFICGPSPMITNMENILLSMNVPKNKIHFETWWKPH